MMKQKLYRIYLNEDWDLAAVYGFLRQAEDGRRYHDRYLTKSGKENYIADMFLLGITKLEFEDISAEKKHKDT